MQADAPRDAFAGFSPADSPPSTPIRLTSHPRRSDSGSSDGSLLLREETWQSLRRRCTFREQDSVPHCPAVHQFERANDMTSQPACAAGGLAEVGDVFPATDHIITSGRGSRRAFEGAPCAPSASTVPADIPNHPTRRFLPAVVMHQQPPLAQQHWFPSHSQEVLRVQRQLRCEPMSYPQQVLAPRHETFSKGQLAQCGWRQREHSQNQQKFDNGVQDGISCFNYQVNEPIEKTRMRYSTAEVAPSSASINKAICSLSQKTSHEAAEAVAVCPFGRLRALGNRLEPATSLSSRRSPVNDDAYAPDQSSLSPAAELFQVQVVSRGQMEDTLSTVPPAAPLDPTSEGAPTADRCTTALRSVSSAVAVTGKTTACRPAAAQDRERAVKAEDREASAVRGKKFALHLSSLPASIAPAVHEPKAAGDDTTLLASDCFGDCQTGNRNTRVVQAWQTNVYRRIMHDTIPVCHSDAADAFLTSSAVEAFIECGDTAGTSLHECSASATGAPRCRSTWDSALSLSPSQAIKESLAGTAEVSRRLFTGGASLGRESSVAKASDIPAEEKSTCATANDVDLRRPAWSCEGCEDEPTRTNEVFLSGKVQHMLISPVEGADSDKPEKLQVDVSKQGTHGCKGEQQQAGQKYTKEPPRANVVVKEHPRETEQRIQQLEKAVSVQQMSVEEDVRIFPRARHHASAAVEGRSGALQLPQNDCYALHKIHTVPLDTAAASGSDTSESRGCMNEECRKQKTQPCGDADRFDAVESLLAERSFNTVGEYASSAPRKGSVAEIGVRTPPWCASRTADLSVTWQPAVPPPARISAGTATAAFHAAAHETTGSSFRWINAADALQGAIDPATAPRGASAVGRSFSVSHSVPSWPRTASGSLCPTESSLPFFTSRAMVSQIRLRSQRRCIPPSLEPPVSGFPTCATTCRRFFPSSDFTSRLYHLPSGGSVEKLDYINAEATALSTIAPATTLERVLRRTSTSEDAGTGNITESASPIPLVLPCDRNCSLLLPGSSGPRKHGAAKSANQFHGDAVMDAPYVTCVAGEAAATFGGPTGFPSYPACVTGSAFRKDLFSADALHHTDPANGGLVWRAPIALYGREEPQEVCVRAPRWVSYPVATAHQQASRNFRFSRRRCICGSTEERERRQLRFISCIVGALLLVGIFCRNRRMFVVLRMVWLICSTPVVTGAMQILIGYPVLYILRSLMHLMLRISASFACTAFVFVFAGRLVLERLKMLRLACTTASSAVVGQSSRNSYSHSDGLAAGHSSLQQYPSNGAPSPQPTVDRAGNREAEGSGKSGVSAAFRSLAECAPRSRDCGMQRPPEVECNTTMVYSDAMAPSAAVDENFVPFLGSWIAFATLRVEALTKLGHLSNVVLRRSLRASKTVAAHLLPLVSVAASAAVSFVTAVDDFSGEPTNVSEHRSEQECAESPESAAHVLRQRESETLFLQEQHAESLSSN